MSMFSRLHTSHCCKRTASTKRGFSLVELLVSAAIITIVMVAVIVRFSSFDSSVLLKSLAYDVAVSIRQAQVYSLGTFGQDEDFEVAYGMSFTPGTQSFIFFLDADDSPPQYDAGEEDEIFSIGRSLQVSDVCVLDSGFAEHCSAAGVTRLDVSFMRPEFDALIYAAGYSGSIAGARVKVSSLDSTVVWYVEVSLTGQITVNRE